jgi:hypothetical protein
MADLPPPPRPDFSHSLVHLTRGRAAAPGREPVTPFQVLTEILVSGLIRGSGNTGYVKGSRPAACLSEIPLSSLREFTKPPAEKAKYSPYGIVLSKGAVFQAGGRPVIYLPDAETGWIPRDEIWRVVRFEEGTVDFTHEREWRVLGDLDLTKFLMFVLVWSAREARQLHETLKTPLKDRILGFFPMGHLITMM